MRRLLGTVALAVVCLSVAGCGDDESDTGSPGDGDGATPTGDVIDPGDSGDYTVEIDPANFTSVIDHPYLPIRPGTVWTYEATGDDGEIEIITVEVLDEYRIVMGVETIVVHDTVHDEDGELIEDTFDWFAQDADGNVWYFGEDTASYDEGVASEAGAWEAGVDGALPGIVMPAEPTVSETGYRQEYLAGEAEDMGQIIAVDGSVSVPAGEFDDVIVTRDWTPLEPDVVEEKTYARGVGFVYETKAAGAGPGEEVALITFTAGS